MKTEELSKEKEVSAFCNYCNTLTWQEVWTSKTDKIVICKTCNMEAAQLLLFPERPNRKKVEVIKSFKQVINNI
jgi:hypothetical protein